MTLSIFKEKCNFFSGRRKYLGSDFLNLSFLTRDGSKGIIRDYAVPTGQFPPFGNGSLSREIVPTAGFM